MHGVQIHNWGELWNLAGKFQKNLLEVVAPKEDVDQTDNEAGRPQTAGFLED